MVTVLVVLVAMAMVKVEVGLVVAASALCAGIARPEELLQLASVRQDPE